MSTPENDNRRAHPRLSLRPGYCPVNATRVSQLQLDGHAYDISASGVRIELDEPLPAGERVALSIMLPGSMGNVAANGEVMWVNDGEDDPGPRRMALRFGDFASDSDRRNLLTYLDAAHALAA